MIVPRRRAIATLIAGALAFAMPGPPPLPDQDPPLTNVDIVRMSAARVPQEEILRAIRATDAVAFDLDAEVIVELRRAGVSEAVIEAMREAMQRAMAETPGGTAGDAGEGPDARGDASAGPGDAPPGAILLFEGDMQADPRTRTAVFFRESPDERPVALSLFVLCVAPTHVPDFWQTKTPLARGAPRHRLVAFHEESEPYPARRRDDLIMLSLPPEVSLPLDEGPHTIVLGVAARVGEDPPVPIAHVESRLIVPPGAPARITIAIATRNFRRMKAPPRGVPLHTVRVVAIEPDPGSGQPDP